MCYMCRQHQRVRGSPNVKLWHQVETTTLKKNWKCAQGKENKRRLWWLNFGSWWRRLPAGYSESIVATLSNFFLLPSLFCAGLRWSQRWNLAPSLSRVGTNGGERRITFLSSSSYEVGGIMYELWQTFLLIKPAWRHKSGWRKIPATYLS